MNLRSQINKNYQLPSWQNIAMSDSKQGRQFFRPIISMNQLHEGLSILLIVKLSLTQMFM